MDPLRYLVNFDSQKLKTEYYDVIILGSGIAGIYTALKLDPALRIAVLSKEEIEISNSVLAQGGIAVSLEKSDSPELHFKDTLYAGAGMCDEQAVWVLVNEAAENIAQLIDYKVKFDKNENLELSFSREAAHSKNRIIHVGDSTGKEVLDKLISVVRKCKNVEIKERTFVVDLLTDAPKNMESAEKKESKADTEGIASSESSVKGVLVYSEKKEQYMVYRSNYIVCAMGGYGQLFSNTSNPEVATGDGIALAYRAGAELMDLEFIQFHPTVLFHKKNKNFLISEAVRGEGAILRNVNGETFMSNYHELMELAPRDVVSRAIFAEMKKTNCDHVFLDITFKDKVYLKNRFPNIYKTCKQYDIDISKDFIPVAPAEHYCMGGIKTDVYGRTNIKGFFAAGEAACNGIHGANRLASNSLLEGLVFGGRVAKIIEAELNEQNNERENEEMHFVHKEKRKRALIDPAAVKLQIQQLMSEHVGIVRNEYGLKQAMDELLAINLLIMQMKNDTNDKRELQNMALLSRLVVESAYTRKESRGAHFRDDYPLTDNQNWMKNIIISRSK